ncbi:hypothetical protein FHR81_003248 [Actinoalloteichus hoggarensis]|uniref:Uncharacterized protein n=1 Tax=Actinoalloteichus hoggarensis TaxID=1470176 RepID=A0A221W773_9PSEU|nr:hypothetical protein [Actinoalloteichus hoggarensis]ASO21604.1 hypothetical protein AHOG_19930 [Actinoalloteichus hoggarensis]MBB5922196.1 hypothetical protein [Actinoalloteichus hoggarensis]
MSRHGRHARPTWWDRVRTWWRGWWTREEGRVTAFVVTLVLAVLALAGLALDGGLALAAQVRAAGQAQSAARAGAQALDLAAFRDDGALRLHPARAAADAHDHLDHVGATGVVSASEAEVTVTVTASHRTQLLSLIGISELAVGGEGTARPERGDTALQP